MTYNTNDYKPIFAYPGKRFRIYIDRMVNSVYYIAYERESFGR